jgi:23S rRNA A2030 N6-methylase RlmJ
MADQFENAANSGDILKHPLISDVLKKCIGAKWKNITYAETHAGAGIYSSKNQPEAQHIINLKSKHGDAKKEARDKYWEILNTFWNVAGNHTFEETKYAGSACLAASILKEHHGTNFDIRLTEYKYDICEDLKSSLCDLLPTEFVDNHIKQDGFQNQITWLTEKDDLVLIIDPFNLSKDSSEINRGGIDQDTLFNVIEKVRNKVNAVLGFWYPIDYRSPIALKLSSSFDKTIIEKYGELNCRKYWFGKFHFIFIGFGGGKTIVNDLPSQSDLQNRWFDLDIKEKLFPQRLKQSLNEIHASCDNFKATFRNVENLKITLENIDTLKEMLEKNDNSKIFEKFKRINITPQCIDGLKILIQQIIDKL